MRSPFLLLLGLFLSVISARSESLVFAEGGVLGQIASSYNMYKAMNGKEPQSWADIETIFNTSLNKSYEWLQPTTRYAFLEKPFVLPGPGYRIVILSRSPAYDQYKMRGLFGPLAGILPSSLHRYAIVTFEDGSGAGVMSFPETTVQKMFSEARIALPSPDPLGPRLYEKGNIISFFLWLGIVLLLAGISGRFVILPIWKRAVAWRPT